jgi:DNA invertase Pin-like site-specific DNA recombinase
VSLIGYARVSTGDQKLDAQLDALKAAGCERIFQDKISGTKSARPGFDALLEHLRPGDVLVTWKLDRLGRSVSHLVELVADLQRREVDLLILTMGIDTRTPIGRLIFTIFAGIAEFERELIVERTTAGLAAARARGRLGGRPAALTEDQADLARSLYEGADPSYSVTKIAETFGVSRGTIYNVLEAK